MGRWGLSELPAPPVNVVGLMSHLATADSDPDFARTQIERFEAATAGYANVIRHIANSAAALRIPESHLDAARCGVALYGMSPSASRRPWTGSSRRCAGKLRWPRFGSWRTGRARGTGGFSSRGSRPGSALVPVGYADGFRRDMTGTKVHVEGRPCRVVGAVSMDAIAIELDRELPVGRRSRLSATAS